MDLDYGLVSEFLQLRILSGAANSPAALFCPEVEGHACGARAVTGIQYASVRSMLSARPAGAGVLVGFAHVPGRVARVPSVFAADPGGDARVRVCIVPEPARGRTSPERLRRGPL